MSSLVSGPLGADPNNNNTHGGGGGGGAGVGVVGGTGVVGDKCYSLRPRAATKRGDEDDGDLEEAVVWTKRKSRKKGKPAPLSKYRRKTANARERSRMREINEAFDSLRRAVPGGEPEKLTKITTLRLAMKYIAALREALAEGPAGPDSDAESLMSDSTNQEMSASESSLTPPLPPLCLLDAHVSDSYSDFSDTPLPLDPYADFSSFVLDDSFPTDFS